MQTEDFKTLWHTCLYGFGEFPFPLSQGLVDWPLFSRAVDELQQRYDSSVSMGSDLTKQSDHLGLGCNRLHQVHWLSLAKRLSSYSEANLGVESFLYSLGESQKELSSNLSDRELYDLLTCCAMLYSSPGQHSAMVRDVVVPVEIYRQLIFQINDPFLYARSAALLCCSIAISGATLRVLAETTALLEEVSKRFVREYSSLLGKDSDGVHSSNDYIHFSACLLLDAFFATERCLARENDNVVEQLTAIAANAFSGLQADNAASQYSFFRLASRRGSLCLPGRAEETFGEVLANYVRQGDLSSPYAYLRCAYLLVESAVLKMKISETIQVRLIAVLMARLASHNQVRQNCSVNYKYDSDVLCLCYGFAVANALEDKQLADMVSSASQSLMARISSLNSLELFKIVHCGVGFREIF